VFDAEMTALLRAVLDGYEPTTRASRAVGAGILGLIPLEAGLLAGSGAIVPAAGVATLWPLARKAAKKRAVT